MELQGWVLKELWKWDRDVLGVLLKRVNNARRELERCRRRGISQQNVNNEHILKYKLERLEDQLHMSWKQCADNVWLLKEGQRLKEYIANQ